VHCDLDREDHGEMTTAEIKGLLDQLADTGVFFLILSGGEIFLRKDLFEIVEYARELMFSVKLKTSAVMIRRAKAERIATLAGNVEEFCAPPAGPLDEADAMDTLPCSAGHTAGYVSPYGDVYPCVQFPLPSVNVRPTQSIDIWQNSSQLKEVRSISMSDLEGCSKCVHGSSCSRCPGLAYMEGNMRGPSVQDCEKSYARTGVPSWNLLQKKAAAAAQAPVNRTAPPPASSSAARPVVWMARK
jgi:radical SAM protein with 4Fe4S-binding SPASM domain